MVPSNRQILMGFAPEINGMQPADLQNVLKKRFSHYADLSLMIVGQYDK